MFSKVAMFDEDRGYGFIRNDASAKDLFFHASHIVPEQRDDPPEKGDEVRFAVDVGEKGLIAKNVRAA